MCKQCVRGSLSSSLHVHEPGVEAMINNSGDGDGDDGDGESDGDGVPCPAVVTYR